MRQLKIVKQVTNRDAKSLEKYFQEISKIGLITADEEVELALKIKKGDNRALAKRFDETRGFKFISYAVWWIRQAIMQALAEQSRIVRLPLNKIGSINKIRKIYARLEQDEQRMPTNKEIAKQLDMSESEVEQSLKNSGRHVSMDAPFKEGEDSNLYNLLQSGDSPKPDNELMKQSLKIEINRALDTLTFKEAKVIKMYYGINEVASSLSEIGEKFDLTRERVRQLKQRAIMRLQSKSKTQMLRTYLG